VRRVVVPRCRARDGARTPRWLRAPGRRYTARALQLRALVLFLPLSVLGACADGGEENRPQSEVRFSATHHVFGFRSLRGFGSFPVPATAVFSDRGILNLFDDSTYTLSRSSGTSAPDRYALENDGELSVYVTGSGREPSVVFKGAYGRVGAGDVLSPGATPDLFFTDRVVTQSSQSVGLYVGTRRVTGQVELEGAWHVLSLHAVFGQTILAPDNVARGAHGGVVIDAGAPGTVRGISGTGLQGATQLTFGGTIQNLLTNGSGDGTCNLTVDYTISAQTDSRVMLAAATNNLVLALDEDESDNEAGLLFMVRKFLAPIAAVDSVRVPGTFLVGGHTLFVNPSNSGSDAFVGKVTLTANGGFRLDAIGNTGSDFSYTGTFSLAQDGGMTIAISGTNETWFGAIDRSYNTFAFVDDFVETRANNVPELNLGFGVREKLN
jgi:hypothetical protein